jgi:cbb3-type cytochrome oxidase maturation protein
MSVLYIVLPLAILLAIAAVMAFAWAVRTGQMDDLKTPALRMLNDDVMPGTASPKLAVQVPADQSDSEPAGPDSDADRVDSSGYSRAERERLSATYAETPVARARQNSAC